MWECFDIYHEFMIHIKIYCISGANIESYTINNNITWMKVVCYEGNVEIVETWEG